MSTWNSRGLRGSTLEEMVNRSIEQYRDQQLALIQKIPTPITPIRMDKSSGHITLAYFEQKSTVDYIGTVQGIPVCFDAKECKTDRFPIANVHPHQIRFMTDFEQQKGVTFLLIFYSSRDLFYYLPYEKLMEFWNRSEKGEGRSFRFDELDPAFVLPHHPGIMVPFLDALQVDLHRRDEKVDSSFT